MIKLYFKINKPYLLIHSLSCCQKLPFPEWVNLQNKLWKKFPESFNLFCKPDIAFITSNYQNVLKQALLNSNEFLNSGLKSPEFKKLYQETKKYLNFVSREWDKNGNKALKILKEITGLKIPSKKIDVLITHPRLRNGQAFPKQNIITWGHSEDWKNYSIIYLCHEILHIIIPEKYQEDERVELLIMLSTDFELVKKLNKKNRYKESDLPKKIVNIWQRYLSEKRPKSIIELLKTF